MISVRRLRLVARQAGNAFRAVAMATSTSPMEAKATWRATRPVAGS